MIAQVCIMTSMGSFIFCVGIFVLIVVTYAPCGIINIMHMYSIPDGTVCTVNLTDADMYYPYLITHNGEYVCCHTSIYSIESCIDATVRTGIVHNKGIQESQAFAQQCIIIVGSVQAIIGFVVCSICMIFYIVKKYSTV